MEQFCGSLAGCDLNTGRGERACKKYLQQFQRELRQCFLNDPHQSVRPLLRCYSEAVDTLLKQLWLQSGMSKSGVTLMAVGGYGRQEMFPFSDIDLLLLRNPDKPLPGQKIASFMSFLWDIGLKAGHSVRTHEECVQIAAEDITVLTSMDDGRRLAGPKAAHARLMQALQPGSFGDAHQYYQARRDAQDMRHEKYRNTEFRLEPNIKNAPGGLRDLQTLEWIARRTLMRPRGMVGLVGESVLTRKEYRQLLRTRNDLWRIRFALHCIVKKPSEQLLFENQLALARLFGYSDDAAERSVEKFMRHYFRRVRVGMELSRYLMQRYKELITGFDAEKKRRINRRFHRTGSTIGVNRASIFVDAPEAMLEIFTLLSNRDDIDNINAETIRLLRTHRKLIDERVRDLPKAKKHFLKMLSGQYGLAHQLRRMSRYRILQRYLPEFGQIVGITQFDLYHIYSVDAHTIRVIEHMRSFRKPEMQREMPEIYNACRELPSLELLYLAGLYHDIGKGRGGDHSVLGSADVEAFAERHRLPAWNRELLSWLVRNHLLMSNISQRQDLSDPQVIADFAERVGSTLYLNYLYLLTIADILGTNPSLWNSWRASLLHELYAKSRDLLSRDTTEAPPRNLQSMLVAETRRMKARLRPLFPTAPLDEVFAGLGSRYFAQTHPDVLYWQLSAILRHENADEPLVVVNNSGRNIYEQVCRVFVYAPNSAHLFARVAIGFSQLNLSVLHARAITSADQSHSLNTYVIQRPDNSPVDAADFAGIAAHLSRVLSEKELPRVSAQSASRKARVFKIAPHAYISRESRAQWSLQVQCLNDPNTLARIGSLLMKRSIWIEHARIVSLGERVEYIFGLNAQHNTRLNRRAYRESLCSAVEGHIAA